MPLERSSMEFWIDPNIFKLTRIECNIINIKPNTEVCSLIVCIVAHLAHLVAHCIKPAMLREELCVCTQLGINYI